MHYALIDWDNTIHRGYTIYGLAGHLLAKGLVSPGLLHTFKELETLYQTKAITYAVYTERTCESFAQELAGRSAAEYRSAVQAFLPIDEPAIFESAYPLFDLLKKYGVAIYFVSGAPFDVLEAYAERFGIRGVFAFELEIENHILTGKVVCNYGVNKDRILHHPLFKTPHATHLLSMGDAVADIPLLNNSLLSIVVGEQHLALRDGLEVMNYTEKPWNLQWLEEKIMSWTAAHPR
ncbi:hypothetical protein Back11_46260 [Paenibacillus baekrokdamisoli]|uniref:Uncharacterized protein n=1 Tax=Paenibacillus baekrokdamisoli TaxID=1712516 RepID=A0A3G9JBL0_9BACL|nr:HAD family hydrolase [Paenibacillus baekrokdamisoli]MBB3073289.1 phosphoserine phosphatase [Paenibacillus baekrokdamisoli]BBH23281.1 hypothetical protein Back11_46260 [Paenibacillus baekrokdamisoli]